MMIQKNLCYTYNIFFSRSLAYKNIHTSMNKKILEHSLILELKQKGISVPRIIMQFQVRKTVFLSAREFRRALL